MNYLTMDVISDIIYGQSFDLVTKCDHRALVDTIMTSSCHGRLEASFPTFLNASFKKWLDPDKSFTSPLANGRQRLFRVLAKLTEERTQSQDNNVDRNDSKSVLSIARDPKTGEKLTEAEVRDEARSMLVLGWSPLFEFIHLKNRANSDVIHRKRHYR